MSNEDPQDDTLFGQWLRDNAHPQRLPRERPLTRTRTAIFATLIGIVVITSVLPVAWWTSKAIGLW